MLDARANVWIQQGTVFTPNIELKRAFQEFRKHCQTNDLHIHVTSGNDSDHMMGSMHYSDDAVDILHNGVSLDEIKLVFGPDFDIVKYSWGFHIEYDP